MSIAHMWSATVLAAVLLRANAAGLVDAMGKRGFDARILSHGRAFCDPSNKFANHFCYVLRGALALLSTEVRVITAVFLAPAYMRA